MRRQELSLQLEFLWKPDVIGIKERDQLALGDSDSVVTRGRNALVFLANVFDFAIVRLNHVGSVVDRPVVDDDDLEILVGLAYDAVNRRADVGRGIVRRYYDTYSRGSQTSLVRV